MVVRDRMSMRTGLGTGDVSGVLGVREERLPCPEKRAPEEPLSPLRPTARLLDSVGERDYPSDGEDVTTGRYTCSVEPRVTSRGPGNTV